MKSSVSEIAIIGAACRLPGADSLPEFWRLLQEGRNSVRAAPKDRWSVERFLRPGNPEPGFTYSFAGGYLETPFAFDPAPFGISPREAQQMDPQQRLLLEICWQAFEDAGLPPSQLAGRPVGVYVGASLVDYQNGASHDPAVIESHFMTGNSLSILSNRVSYVFDLKGPSFTVDSACSSSFVALSQAIDALNDGEIELAIVGGVNLLLSPVPFIGFSQARMLSPTGLSRPFSAQADGYVRAEGSVVLVLRRQTEAERLGERVRGTIIGAAINSDGRTTGISLPSLDGQQRLIEAFYAKTGVSPDDLAFVEAHGTGTKVGDPIEATAIGQSLGQKRRAPLLIGSVKSNIGHLEAASGLAGLLKSVLALEHRVLPPSLFIDQTNENIDFARLNLAPNARRHPLDVAGSVRYAGICNYGFGGTNAHVLVRASRPAVISRAAKTSGQPARHLVASAADRQSLVDHAGELAAAIEAGTPADDIARALGHGRDLLKHRLVIPLAGDEAVAAALRSFAGGTAESAALASGIANAADCPVVFVFSGNGSQFPEMGKAAYASNARFRAEIAEIDQIFEPLAGWSIANRLKQPIPADLLQQTSVAQPMIFAIQSALAGCLAEAGIVPELVLGHSVGEVAAAEASGALSRADAVRLVYLRSKHQENARGLGRMLVAACDRAEVERLLQAFGHDEIEIAAVNSATSTTVSGPGDRLKSFAKHCRAARVATIPLDIDYPFHSSALEPLKARMIDDLGFLAPRPAQIGFVSTVTGTFVDGAALDAQYWWQNIRQTVHFEDALVAAANQNGKIFVEVGPRAILTGAIAENLRDAGITGETLASLSQKDAGLPVELTIARLIASGARLDRGRICGTRPRRPVVVPSYAFQRQTYSLPDTPEALNAFGRLFKTRPRHPLLGARMAEGSPEWRNLVDPVLLPYLDDHRVDGGVIVPAAGLIEMALAAGRDLFGDRAIELDEFDVLKALAIAQDETREVSTRFAEGSGTIEIWSRKRFSTQDWVLHARGQIGILTRPPTAALAPPIAAEKVADTAAEVYAEASRAGLEYGPLFQLVTSSERDRVTTDSQLAAPGTIGLGAFDDLHVLHPVSLDAAFHGLFISRPQKEGEKKAHLPVRFRKICVWQQGAVIRRAITLLTLETDRFKTVAISLIDESGAVVASVEAAVLRALYLSKATTADRTFRIETLPVAVPQASLDALASAFGPLKRAASAAGEDVPAPWLVARAFAVSLAHRLVLGLTAGSLRDPRLLVAAGKIPAASLPIVETAWLLLDGFGLVENGVCAADCPLPPPDEILATLSANFPEANLEISLAANALAHVERLVATGTRLTLSSALRDQVESDAILAAPVILALGNAVAAIAKAASRKIRVLALEPWSAGLTHALLPLVQDGTVELTLAAPDRKTIDQARAFGRIDAEIEFLDLSAETAFASPLPFDTLVSVATGPIGGQDGDIAAGLGALLRQDAPVLVAVPGADTTLDFLLGLWSGWFAEGTRPQQGLVRWPGVQAVTEALERFNVLEIGSVPAAGGLGALVFGRLATDSISTGTVNAYAVVENGDPLARAIAKGACLVLKADHQLAANLSALAGSGALPAHLVYAVSDGAGAGLDLLVRHIEAIRTIAEALDKAQAPTRVTIATRGAHDGSRAPSPLASSIWGFVRVAINEMPMVDLRLAEFSDELADPALAARLGETLALGGDELELVVRPEGISALRVRRNLLPPAPLARGERAELRFEQAGRLDSFSWIRGARPALRHGEIEIEVAAVGLNFRDVLVGLGILDDDLLGAGLTAAALGFECAGIVTATGTGVTHLAPGDRVMGFAANAFVSHLVSPAWHFFKVPDGVGLDAAATIPVAFATAWFGLIRRAQIGPGDDVLIHGGAGGVGLAAIQFAKRAGARVIATASSAERRAIARAAGADFTYDSRQERFAEAIRTELGGVDVVLNSLAGPAMEASFKLVKPFGRFVELGKRDYLDNTQLGLRPFVRNIAYFGVDLDELLAHDRPLVERMMQLISDQFASGELKPLPYRVFEAHEVGAAFRLMQASEHVGKIVIRPAKTAMLDAPALHFAPRPGVYLIVGGTSGLGFATARWLAQRGAGTVVLASRRGQVEEGLESEVEILRQAGTRVVIEPLDVTDGAAVDALVRRLTRELGPLRGVIHAAVLLDDGMIASLTAERLRAVLEPKITGALNLDAATADQPLDFFVVYSSATTVIGSPGQGAYVAANSWLEGFARRRRAEGRPALAIGWGAISDVGIIARDKQLGRRLRRTTGVVGISSTESLAHLGRLLALGNAVGPMQFYTNIAAGSAAEKLTLLNSPAFAGLALARREAEGEESGDLLSAIEGKGKADAIPVIVQALKREISQILRMAEDQIDATRPLGELGLDSLMALELQLSIERLCGTDVPMVGAGDRRLADIAMVILSSIGTPESDVAASPDATTNLVIAMSGMHAAGAMTQEDAEALSEQLKVASGGRRGA